MKKLFFIGSLSLMVALSSCKGGSTESTETTTDSTQASIEQKAPEIVGN